MNLIKKSAASVLVAATVTLGAGTAHADPVLPNTGTPALAIPGRHEVDKQKALENMLNELGVGWANGGSGRDGDRRAHRSRRRVCLDVSRQSRRLHRRHADRGDHRRDRRYRAGQPQGAAGHSGIHQHPRESLSVSSVRGVDGSRARTPPDTVRGR